MGSELPSFLSSILLEGWDEQILKKIPHCILFAVVFIYFDAMALIPPDIEILGANFPLATLLMGISLLVFLGTNWHFNHQLNKRCSKIIFDVGFNEPHKLMDGMFAEGKSFVKDFLESGDRSIIGIAIVAGLSLTLLLVVLALQLLNTIALPSEVYGLLIVGSIILVYQDALNPKKPTNEGKDSKLPFFEDLFEKYFIENSFTHLSMNYSLSIVFVRLFGRVIAPVVMFKIPNIAFKSVYLEKRKELVDFLQSLVKNPEEHTRSQDAPQNAESNSTKTSQLKETPKTSDGNSNLSDESRKRLGMYLYCKDVQKAKDFFTSFSGFLLKDLQKKSPKELYPYLYEEPEEDNESEESDKNNESNPTVGKPRRPKRKRVKVNPNCNTWVMFKLKLDRGDRTVGQVIIQQYRSSGDGHPRNTVYSVTIFGERKYVEHFKSKMEYYAPKFIQ